VLAAHNRRYTDDELLNLLRGLLSRVGRLSGAIINREFEMPDAKVYQARFGGLLKAYARIGYTPAHDYSFITVTENLRVRHNEHVAGLIAALESTGASVYHDRETDLLTINSELRLQFVTVRCHRNGHCGERWIFRFDSLVPADITIAARMNSQNDRILDYYIVPGSENVHRLMYCGVNSGTLDLYHFEDLSILTTLVRRIPVLEDT